MPLRHGSSIVHAGGGPLPVIQPARAAGARASAATAITAPARVARLSGEVMEWGAPGDGELSVRDNLRALVRRPPRHLTGSPTHSQEGPLVSIRSHARRG